MNTKKEPEPDDSRTEQKERGLFDALSRIPMGRILTWGSIFVLTIAALGKGKDDRPA